jgi:hypothetical protein
VSHLQPKHETQRSNKGNHARRETGAPRTAQAAGRRPRARRAEHNNGSRRRDRTRRGGERRRAEPEGQEGENGRGRGRGRRRGAGTAGPNEKRTASAAGAHTETRDGEEPRKPLTAQDGTATPRRPKRTGVGSASYVYTRQYTKRFGSYLCAGKFCNSPLGSPMGKR